MSEKEIKFVAKADYGRMEITAPALIPEPYVDAHLDIISEEEVFKACRNFTKNCMQPNLQHKYQLGEDVAEFTESYILPQPTEFNGTELPKGTWMLTMKCKSKALLDAVREGEFNGFSIGANARTRDLK